MTGILAIETATDACSLAIVSASMTRQIHEIIPRRHSQRIFSMLQDLAPGGDLVSHGIEVLAYGSGPGSFTGLRIAASAVQGLAYSTGLPVVAVPTLATMAQTALRTGEVENSDAVLATLDARINECYSALYRFEKGHAILQAGPWVSAPSEHPDWGALSVRAIGDGCQFIDSYPAALRNRVLSVAPDLYPEALDVASLAERQFSLGDIQHPEQVVPVYVRDEISWKKLSEQGARK